MKWRPAQAVILAGGRGTRLSPLTDTRPKPMIEFHSKPFLEYLIELFCDRGVRRVLLLLGYLPEVIQDYFGDGRRWGLHIEYSVTPVEDETGTRLRRAASRLDPVFLLAYADNYWPLPFEEMWNRFSASDVESQVTIYANRDGYTKDNVSVDPEGFVTVYDKGRSLPGLKGVEIGFTFLRREVLNLLPEGNVSFEKTVFPALASRRQMKAFWTEHRYYSVGDFARLGITEEFLARRPTLLVDRDGVLNRKAPRGEYVRTPGEFEWLPGSLEALRLLRDAGYRVIVISNQAGIARGFMTERDLEKVHERMHRDTERAGGKIEAVYTCPHGWDEGCECRKPRPGLLLRAQREFHLDLTRTVFVGDDKRDVEAGRAAGCPTFLVSPETSLNAYVRRHIDSGEIQIKQAKVRTLWNASL
ncbi:MAG: HAD-IIIA family hydrolase [Candidatus Omnitrophica bacterium]|nr:HAD-IIIA family hydrolase [Candidatus Omnitrophota bacterium]